MGEVNGQKVLLGVQSGISVRLDWIDSTLQPDLFQISAKGMSLPCAALSGGTLGEYVQFLRAHSVGVAALIINGLYPGIQFDKDYIMNPY